MTAEERIAEYVKEIASRHLAEMKEGRRFGDPYTVKVDGPHGLAEEYRCETCGSRNIDMCIGWRCFDRVIRQNPLSDEQREMLLRAALPDMGVVRGIRDAFEVAYGRR